MPDLNKYLGQVRPVYGRWSWPFKHMTPGEWFTVRHEDRAPEAVRQMAYVRASQYGKRFSVEANYAPGLTKIECKETQRYDPNAPTPVIDVISGTALAERIEEYTDANVNWMWGANELPAGQVHRKPVTYHKPMEGQRIFVVSLSHGVSKGNPAYVRFDFEEEGIRVERLPGKTAASDIIERKRIKELMA